MSVVTEFLQARLPVESQTRRFVQYLLVGVLGLAINEGTLFLVTSVAGASYVIGGVLGRVVSILANYAVNDVWTWRSRGDPGARNWLLRGGKYVLTRVVGIAIGLATLIVLVELFSMHYLIANVLAVGVGVIWGFGASDRWVWPTTASVPVTDRVETLWTRTAATRRRFWTRLGAIDRPTWYVIGLAGVLFVWFSFYTSLLYRGYILTGADLGTYVHMFSTTLDGHGWLLQGKYRVSHPGGSYWGAHFTLTLLAFLVPYAIAPSAITLLVAKAFVLAASIPLCWLVVRTHVADVRLAGLVTVSYAFNPFFWSAWSFDFQEQAVLPLLIFLTYYAFVKGRDALFLGAFSLMVLTNEFMIFIAFGFLVGLTLLSHRENRLASRSRMLGSGFVIAVGAQLLAGYVISQFSVESGIPTRAVAVPFQQYIEGTRVAVGSLVGIVLAHPQVLIDSLSISLSAKFLFFIALLLPVAFLSLTDELTLSSLTPYLLFAWFLGHKQAYFAFGAHYPFYFLPVLYIGTARILSRVQLPRLSRETASRALVYVILLNVASGLIIAGGNIQPFPVIDDHTRTLDAAIATVPEDATLVTQNNIYPHVANRPGASFIISPYEIEVYQAAYGVLTPEYVLYDSQSKWARVVEDTFVDRLDGEYSLYRYEDGIWVFKRGYDGQATTITSGEPLSWFAGTERRYDAQTLSVGSGTQVEGTIVGGGGPPGEAIWYGPYETLAPGIYTVTYRVFVAGETTGSVARLDVVGGEDHRVLTRKTVMPANRWQEVTTTFTLTRPQSKVEFRGHSTGRAGTVTLDWVRIERREATS
ncbi:MULTISPECIES: DUF2079 domain-containing protein [unclassified Haladaptatus]|uniref:DUF2079 domain-containing protein n=1 Tax=unclassified Haladaptatus TaxID=2622732 RepID=UPI0023E823DA|nr:MULTISPECIES: DUF2079 domain-containing protein [unclassified Haladaptatus]